MPYNENVDPAFILLPFVQKTVIEVIAEVERHKPATATVPAILLEEFDLAITVLFVVVFE